MVALQVPGINVSILRQQTSTQPRVPLLISGRVTALGLPIPALVRVSLEGPTFAPEITNFDTQAAPTGDYAVPILADQDGQFTVTARAYPFVFFPLGLPGLPSPIDVLPPAAVSPSPPIVVGDPVNGGVSIGGRTVPAPPQTSVEISAPVQVSTLIPITIGGAPGAAPVFFPAPTPTGLAPDIPGPIIIEAVITQPPNGAAPAPAPAPAGVVSAQVVGFTVEG